MTKEEFRVKCSLAYRPNGFDDLCKATGIETRAVVK
jgi:hypothetical protein